MTVAVVVDTTAILRFIQLLCDHLDIRFPEEELMEWHACDQAVTAKSTYYEFGKDHVERLIARYSYLIPKKKKVKLSRYTPWRHMERRYSSYSFLTSALDGGEWSASIYIYII
jgi:hypothetical protein